MLLFLVRSLALLMTFSVFASEESMSKKELLQIRAKMFSKTREFFAKRGFSHPSWSVNNDHFAGRY